MDLAKEVGASWTEKLPGRYSLLLSVPSFEDLGTCEAYAHHRGRPQQLQNGG